MYYVYILECSDKSLYTGIATDVEKRFKEHVKGKASHYTSAHRPVKIVYKEKSKDRGTALRREVEIKRMPRDKKLSLIKS
jgi:putative endonuclease